MPHVIHLRCERCGAPTSGAGGWIRCGNCGTVAGFDFTTYTDMPEVAEFTRRNFEDPTGYVERWRVHDAELTRAGKLHARSPAEAMKIAAEQAEFILTETPWVVPPAVKSDAQLREAYKRWLGFELLHYRLPGKVQTLYAELNAAGAAVGFGANENPLPAFQRMLAALRGLLEERIELGSPPDPEGLSLDGRLRVNASQMIAGSIGMVSPELQLDLLRAIYGPKAVEVTSLGAQDYSMFFDWECPQCGLFSPQHVTSDKLTCPGCYAERRLDADAMALDALAAVCHGCGSRVELAHCQMRAVCGFCTSEIKRFVRPGDPYRAVLADIKRKEVEKHGGSYEKMMADSNGFGVTPANREECLRDGLVRIAQWYNHFITPARFLGFARASKPASVHALLQAARELSAQQTAEGYGATAADDLIAAARARLA